jgi:hypothetical protein
MSKALPAFMYKNPQDVLERKQETALKKTCIGCIHSYRINFVSGPGFGCEKGRKFGKRCQHYARNK